jgi:hypothetical protein
LILLLIVSVCLSGEALSNLLWGHYWPWFAEDKAFDAGPVIDYRPAEAFIRETAEEDVANAMMRLPPDEFKAWCINTRKMQGDPKFKEGLRDVGRGAATVCTEAGIPISAGSQHDPRY